jgi:hypothetical protein
MVIAHFSALRHRDFRLWWSGYVISVAGYQMLWVVEGWLIYELAGSKLLFGANGLAQAIPVPSSHCSVGLSPTRWYSSEARGGSTPRTACGGR